MSITELTLQQEIKTLYNNHHGWLYGWLRKKLNCSHRAADLAQDIFLRLLCREEPVLIQEPRAFLTTMAKRLLANHWRREQFERAYLEALAQAPQGLVPSPEERIILMETLMELDKLLEGLPLLVKKAFLHAQLDGMSQSEIAAELGISITTVKRYILRAGTQCYFGMIPFSDTSE
jgi:RNA polymerase sigma-70 factor (ECF subfamily)